MVQKPKTPLALFGGTRSWDADEWTASDDSVRGGKSESHLDCTKKIGRFYGTLDIKTLGGAGFASQRTSTEDQTWDLTDYAGVQLNIAKGDKKRYTLIIKDELLPRDENTGREQATISYECDFELPPQTRPGDTQDRIVTIPWASLNATYRGRIKKDAKPLDQSQIRRFSVMMRSFFGSQEGDFELSLRSITAVTKIPEPGDDDDDDNDDDDNDDDEGEGDDNEKAVSWRSDVTMDALENGEQYAQPNAPSPPDQVRHLQRRRYVMIAGVLLVVAAYHLYQRGWLSWMRCQ